MRIRARPARPVEIDLDLVACGRRFAIERLQLVRDLAIELAGGSNGPRGAVGRAKAEAAVRRLAATAGIEHGPVKHDQRGVTRCLDAANPCGDGSCVGVAVAELLARRHSPYSAVTSMTMFGWTLQIQV